MAESKDAYLDQGYYGPAIPPNQPTTRPAPSSSMFEGCSPYAILCHVLKIITIVLIVIGSVVLVLWLIYQPDALKVYVDSAAVSPFNLSADGRTLSYNLTAVLTVRNPNKRVGIYYKHVQATAFYGDAKLGDVILPLFHQPKKNTTTFDLTFAGPPVAVGRAVNETYRREKGEGWYYVSLRFYAKVRLRMIVINSIVYDPEAGCDLRLPAPTDAAAMAEGFQLTECRVDDFS